MARHSFAKGKTQAERAIVEMAATGIKLNLGTERNTKQSLAQFADWLKQERRGDLRHCDRQAAIDYLEQRAEQVQQKSLDIDRQSIDKLMAHQGEVEPLPKVRSEHDQVLRGRAYTPEQVKLLLASQRLPHALTTELAHRCGIRGHEAFSLSRTEDRSTRRSWRDDLFTGREGELYSVKGKGGLIRWVCVPHDLAERIEARRLEAPRVVTDRGIHYLQHYAIGGGQSWSQSVSTAAARQLGWSSGGHGLRHSYAQERLNELQAAGYAFQDAKAVVSQEMGHFRPSIVECYLR